MAYIPTKEQTDEILLISCAKLGNELYGSTFDDGLTIKVDLDLGECKLIGGVNQFSPINWGYTMGYGLYKNCLFLVEESCRRIAIHSMKDDTINYINLSGKTYSKFSFDKSLITCYKDRLFIFPAFDDELIIVNMPSEKVEKIVHLYPNCSYEYKEVKRNTYTGIIYYPLALISKALRVDNSVYLFSHIHSKVIKFSLDTLDNEIFSTSKIYADLVDVAYENGYFYLLDSLGNVYKWRENCQENIIVHSKHVKAGYYEHIVSINNKIWLLPNLGKDILKIDITSNNQMIYEKYPNDFSYICVDDYRSKYGVKCEDENAYYFSTYATNYMLVINKKNGKEKWLRLYGVGKKEIQQYLFGVGIKSPALENSEFSLNDFLSYKYKDNNGGDVQQITGEKIWDTIK